MITAKRLHDAWRQAILDLNGLTIAPSDYEDVRPEAKKRYTYMADWLKKQERENRPTIVCLCGSTRFSAAFREANLKETLAGKIVLTVGCEWHSDQALGLTEADKERLDELHKRKIDQADEILVLNVGGYIGASTRSEIDYAYAHGKPVHYLESPDEPAHLPTCDCSPCQERREAQSRALRSYDSGVSWPAWHICASCKMVVDPDSLEAHVCPPKPAKREGR